jgi:hypothetical protein
MKLFILPYKMASKSAKLLASSLNVKRIKKMPSRYRQRMGKIVINWGNSTPHPRVPAHALLNDYSAVANATNKLKCLKELKDNGVACVEFTTDKMEAQQWLSAEHTVYARHLVSSSCGRGITIHSGTDILPDVPLYTKKFKTKYEYRVHVAFGSVIDVTMKRLRNGAPETRTRGIRSHDNGWVFTRNDIVPLTQEALQTALDGVRYLDLDFGAVDLLVDRNQRAVICEINTAPGIEGTTLQKYVTAFKSLME